MIGHYLAIAWRTAMRHKLSTVSKIVALSLGLGCFVAAYTVADYFDRYDSHWANAGRIFAVTQNFKTPGSGIGPTHFFVAPPVARYLRADAPELTAVARYMTQGASPVRAGDKTATHEVAAADPDFLKIFNLPFVAGDPLEALSAPKSAIITADAAKSMFGTTDVLGQSLRLNQTEDLTITGVIADIPPPSSFGRGIESRSFDLLVSMDVIDDIYAGWSPDAPPDAPRFSQSEFWTNTIYQTYVLLPEDGSFTRSDLDRRLEGFGARHVPERMGGVEFGTAPLNRFQEAGLEALYLGGKLGASFTTLLYLLGALILGVACLDFANLATAESGARAREIGMRKTMGATRAQICGQTMIEVGMLSTLSLAIAVGAAAMALSAYNHPVDIGLRMPGPERMGFWGGIVLLLAGVTLVAGFYPALVLARVRPVSAIRMGTARGGSGWLRAILIGGQFAATSFLVVVVAVILIQNAKLRAAGLGRTADPVLAIQTSLFNAKVDPATFHNRMSGLAGVKGSSATIGPPISTYTISSAVYATSPDPSAKQLHFNQHGIYYGFFQTMGVKLLAGREFSRERDPAPGKDEQRKDSKPAPPGKIILDRSTAMALGWTPAQAVGKTIYARVHDETRPDGKKDSLQPRIIIGVVEDGAVQFNNVGPRYTNYILNPTAGYPVIQISRTDVQGTVNRIEDAWAELAPDVPLEHQFMDEAFNRFYAMYGRISRAATALALTAIVISAMGLIGMATFIVRRRWQEIGVRKTLGASSAQVLRLLLWDFSKPVVLGSIMPWPAAFFAVQIYLNLFVVRASLTAVPFLLSLAVTLGIAWASVGIQAFRAARVQPGRVLRYE